MRRRRRPGRGQVWSRAALLLVALGSVGFGGFLALERLHSAAAMVMQRIDPARAGNPPGGPVSPLKGAVDKVKITFITQPVVKTDLRWGKKKLGIINPARNPSKKPFFIERPKDSGPMDVVARAEGFLPLNTRVYTFADNKVLLKLTPEADKHTVLGYKMEIPDGGVDGGLPMPDAGGSPLAPIQPLGPAPGPAPVPPARP